MTALDKAGIDAESNDASHRAADNGTQYDWYIRTDIALDETSGGALEKIKKALGPVASVPSAPTLLQETNEAILIIRLQKEKGVLQSRNEELQNKLQELKTGPGTDAEAEIQDLRSQLDGKSKDYEVLLALSIETEDASEGLSCENHTLKRENHTCKADYADLKRDNAKLLGGLLSGPNHFRELLGLTCDRIRLDQKSFSVIRSDFINIEPLFKALQRYNSQEKQALTKLRGFTNDIWELAPPEGHISTGKPEVGSLGRVYFRRTAEGDPVAFVRVKQDDTEQQRALRLTDKSDPKDSLGLG